MAGESCLISQDHLPLRGRHFLGSVHPSSTREARGISNLTAGGALALGSKGEIDALPGNRGEDTDKEGEKISQPQRPSKWAHAT